MSSWSREAETQADVGEGVYGDEDMLVDDDDLEENAVDGSQLNGIEALMSRSTICGVKPR